MKVLRSLVRLILDVNFQVYRLNKYILFPCFNIQDQDSVVTQACSTIAQLIAFNAKKSGHGHAQAKKKTRHSKNREPPLPVYVGLNT